MSWKDIVRSIAKGLTGKSQKQVVIPDPTARPKQTGASAQQADNSKKPERLPEHLHQYPDLEPNSPRKQLVIGLDFGTAFTKAVIGEERARYAVSWYEGPNNLDDYLLPGIFYVTDSGECSLERNAGRAVDELKMRLLSGERDLATLAEVCAFSALVLRRIRGFLLNRYRMTYGESQIDWLINVGLPTDDYHSTEFAELYKSIMLSAWWVSIQPGKVTLEACIDALEKEAKSKLEGGLHPDLVTLFPEFVAQVTGYVRSPMRDSDLHMLVDVGAGTVDATIFNVHEHEGEDRFPIFAKSVKPLGTRFLVKNRLKGSEVQEEDEFGHFEPIPAKVRFLKSLGITESQLKAIDSEFKKELYNSIDSIMTHTYLHRYPESQKWKTGIPIFLCGGGAKCDFYRELLSFNKLGRHKIIMKDLPKPDNVLAEGLATHEYDRLSVAYGLSYDPFDIGDILKSEDFKDDPKISDPQGETSFSCQKCNGTGGLHRGCDACGGSGFVRE